MLGRAGLAVMLGSGCIVQGLLDAAPEDGTTSSSTSIGDGDAIDPLPDPGSTTTTSSSSEPGTGPMSTGTAETSSGEDDQRDPPVPPPANRGECCEPSRGTGCGDPMVEACVCAADPRCCTDGWDELCVDHIDELGCGGCTFGPAGLLEDCCSPHGGPGCGNVDIAACVCATDPYCCDVAWDQICVDAIGNNGCGVCPGPYAPEDCCTPGEVAGCPDPDISECVCAQDPYCCEDHWDELCVDEATTYCGGCLLDAGTSGDVPPPDGTTTDDGGSSSGGAMTY